MKANKPSNTTGPPLNHHSILCACAVAPSNGAKGLSVRINQCSSYHTTRPLVPTMTTATRSLVELCKLQRTQLKSINKDDLIDAIMSAGDGDVAVGSRLEEQLTTIARELTELRQTITSSERSVDKRLAEMQEKIDKQAAIIMQQQLFLENIDRKERERNLVVLGVPDDHEGLDGATSDEAKLQKIWAVIDDSTVIRSHRRLGQHNSRKRPILVVVESKDERDNVLGKTRKLKDQGAPYDKIYIKKDVHPAVRREWKRLHDAKKTETERPENQGCNIHLDTKERKLYRNGVEIDKWNLHHF